MDEKEGSVEMGWSYSFELDEQTVQATAALEGAIAVSGKSDAIITAGGDLTLTTDGESERFEAESEAWTCTSYGALYCYKVNEGGVSGDVDGINFERP